MTEFAMTEIEMLAAQLRTLTAALDRLTARIDALPGTDAGTAAAGGSVIADRIVFADRDAVPDAFAWPSEEELGRYLASTGRMPGARP